MGIYILQRLVQAIPTFFIAMALVFFAIRLVPGDQLTLLIGEQVVGKADRAALKRDLGLDKPLLNQYGSFVGGVLRGDLGRGTFDKEPVREKIAKRLPVTLELTFLSMLIAILIAIPIGVLSAIKRNSAVDYGLRLLALLALSIPSFWLGTLVLVALALWFGWVPTVSQTSLLDAPLENLEQFILPALILGATLAGSIMRITRSMMLEILAEDYVRVARAKGLAGRTVLLRHAIPNALIPVITVIGLQVTALLGGTVVIESIFGLPGLGTLLTGALTRRDYPVVQGINVVLVSAVILVNLLIDVLYVYIDPRLRSRSG
jgi:peptide/nickel transport system permease protein